MTLTELNDNGEPSKDVVGNVAGGSADVAVQYDSVEKNFGPVKALRGVSFNVRQGEIHAVVGENGAGKSTLVGLTTAQFSPTNGNVVIFGETVHRADPRIPQQLGVAAVRQEPALFGDLTVAENLWLKVVDKPVRRPRLENWAADVLKAGVAPGLVDPGALVSNLTVEERYTVELAGALHSNPRLLLLDEPTEHLNAHLVRRLFDRLRELASRGVAVIYISHRLPDVISLADRISVLRDGTHINTSDVGKQSLKGLVEMIAGRPVDAIFPDKTAVIAKGENPALELRKLRGTGFRDVDLSVAAGEIVGLAGIDGNGQEQLLRGIAGLAPVSGGLAIQGTTRTRWNRQGAVGAGVEYVPRDRREEGLFPTLSVLANLRVYAVDGGSWRGVVRRRFVQNLGAGAVGQFKIRTPSLETPASALSGGNAQKTVIARSMMRKPAVLLLDEPTQGVDVGARQDIYRYIRAANENGAAVLIASSDADELQGLCDTVLVFSRGRIIRRLSGAGLTERAVVEAAVTADTTAESAERSRGRRTQLPLLWSALLLVNLLVILLGVRASERYLSEINIGFVLANLATLGFMALAQQAMLFMGGVDLSVGPLGGLVVLIGSYTLVAANPSAIDVVQFAFLCLLALIAVALANWFLADVVGLTPFVGTLATFIFLQALAISIRPSPGGLIAAPVQTFVATKIGPIPVAILVCLATVLVLEFTFYRTKLGARLRAVGSSQDVAAVVGLRPQRARLLAFGLASLLAVAAGLMFLSQVGIGTNSAGVTYSISSMTAAIIGGATMSGGRGSFIGAFLGALLLQQTLTVGAFMRLGDATQYYFIGGLILVAAVVPLIRLWGRVLTRGRPRLGQDSRR